VKRYGNLFEEIVSKENIRLAHRKARVGKSGDNKASKKWIKRIDDNLEHYVDEIHKSLTEGIYVTSEYTTFIKNDTGKERVIHSLPYYPDRIVHHAIMNIVEPIWVNSLIRDTYSSVKGRGVHDAVRRIKRALQRDVENTTYCLKMDIKKFYPSIQHGVAKDAIRKTLKDPKVLALLDEIIDSHEEAAPIGGYPSQHIGNLVLNGIDHKAKEDKELRHYYRYCDDVVVFHSSKERLWEVKRWFEDELSPLSLSLKKNYQVFPVDQRGADFLGYVFNREGTKVRKRISKRFKKKVKHFRENSEDVDPTTLLSTVMSYKGWFGFADAGRLFDKHVDDSLKNKIYIKTGVQI